MDVVPGSVLTLTAAAAEEEEEDEDDDESEDAGGDFSFDLPVETEAKRRHSISLLCKIQSYANKMHDQINIVHLDLVRRV